MRLAILAIGAASIALCLGAAPGPARAAVAYCAGGRVQEQAQNAPAALAPAVARAFGVAPDAIDDAAFVRCVGGRLMACWVGANLDCGKADMRRNLVGASSFCRENPGSAVVPMAATGHATIYSWRCVGRRAIAGAPTEAVDAQGYIAANWRELP